jgi:hypothetical protein
MEMRVSTSLRDGGAEGTKKKSRLTERTLLSEVALNFGDDRSAWGTLPMHKHLWSDKLKLRWHHSHEAARRTSR